MVVFLLSDARCISLIDQGDWPMKLIFNYIIGSSGIRFYAETNTAFLSLQCPKRNKHQ